MKPITHDWNLSPTEAVKLQKELREKILLTPLQKDIQYIAGADISFNLYSNVFYAGLVVLDYQSLKIVDTSFVKETVDFPYIPGLLSFREIPTLFKAWEKLATRPDVVMVDGHGIAHPRRMGIATHFGLVTGTPTLGCAKKILTGKYAEPAPEKANHTVIFDKNEPIGFALRTKNNVKPVFISPGHLMNMENALAIAQHCALKYKLPEPTRLAHNAVNEFRKKEMAS